jgi:diguanylate cyclase (GGDEF)-like protein
LIERPPDAVRVLLVDDDEDDYVLTATLLADSRRSQFKLDWVDSFAEAQREIARREHDIYLIDFRLGDHDGIELLSWALNNGCNAPMIVLTGQGREDIDLAAMRAGAADFLVKGEIDAPLLERSIRYSLAQYATLQALRDDAFHDALTGLPNRLLFLDRLHRAMDAFRREATQRYAVLFFDLDRFKVINDSLGHAFGDLLLVQVAYRLQQTIRASDTVARLGGDEFAVLVEQIEDASDAVRAAQRIHDSLLVPFQVGGHEIFTTASIGIAVSRTSYEAPEEVLRDADIAMYRAKGAGKNRHEIFDAAMHEHVLTLLGFETDLRRAIERAELQVHYQPIVSLADQSIKGMEALVRWQRGSELVAADTLIAVAEETGLIIPIGDWVLRQAVSQLAEWNNGLDIHVNLSARQLLQPQIVQRVSDILREHDVDASRLHLEITESVLIENAEAAARLLSDLREIRVGLSLDDFGTGYSSLSSLRQFPFDMLKIDRSFLLDADVRRSSEIVRTIASLAGILGMRVTIEGVETEEQLARIAGTGVDFAQGFLFGKPAPAVEVSESQSLKVAKG